MKMLLNQKHPTIGTQVFIAPSADVLGDVRLADDSSVFYNCVLRGDINYIQVGTRSNIQDLTCMHVADEFPCIVGNDCVIGHSVILHGCTLETQILVGMGAAILNGATIGSGSIIGARALVTENMNIPERSLVMGIPAKVVRKVRDDEYEHILTMAEKYLQVKNAHLHYTERIPFSQKEFM